MKTKKSDKLFAAAKQRIPGGVNSPVRAFKSVGRNPLFIKRARGAKLWDVDGNEFIDYVGTWGPAILGHAHHQVLEAIRKAMVSGTSFGAPSELEVKMAELICKIVPSVEMVRMVNSGTEATMSAIRLARAFTRRDKIIKFDGCYHGHGDSFLIKAGSGAMTFGVPDSPGVPKSIARLTFNATFNSIESVKRILEANRGEVAAVIIEPVVGNMGCIPPDEDFLKKLRALCTREKVLLIFDEVMTGFRLARGGAQELYNSKPDLSTFGKIIGGGLPVGAYGGRKDIMQLVAPSGPMYQAGTLSGNPLAMAAGLQTLSIISRDKSFYKKLETKSRQLADGLSDVVKRLGVPVTLNRVGSMSTVFFTEKEVRDAQSALASDREKYAKYFREMLEQGIYLAPSQFEAGFISIAHSTSDIERTVRASRKALEAAFS